MNTLINELVSKAQLSNEQAEKVAHVVKGFLADKLPEALRGPVESALTGDKVEGALDAAKGMLGGLLK